jgi:pyruvate,orthophosphate dikinase
MTYGLSRDDAGRFVGPYVQQGVFAEDPFHKLDLEGVGELLTIGVWRGRQVRRDIVLSACGEHAGDPTSVLPICGLRLCLVFAVPGARGALGCCSSCDQRPKQRLVRT